MVVEETRGYLLMKCVYNNSFYILTFLQIRQEKPYYIADPEVDSLVSKIFLILEFGACVIIMEVVSIRRLERNF
jgi:hypothetical protein